MIESSFNSALEELTAGNVTESSYLLGVSGGIDSICMAELFLRSHFHPHFAIAHVNFSLRGEDSIKDMNFVKEWAERNSIHFFCTTLDTLTYAREHSISIQMAARDLRYDWFRKVMEKEGFDYLSIAHNLDDSIETIFLNIVRGTGIKGLSGISCKNGNIIRPLLCVTRKEIADFVSANSISYRDDRTNFESHYSRNRIRNIIFPEFKKLNPSFFKTVERESHYFREINDIIEDLYIEKRRLYCHKVGDKIIISSNIVKKEKGGEYWLYRILKEYNFNSGQLPEIVRCLREGQSGKTFLSPTCEMVLNKGNFNIYHLKKIEENEAFVLAEPGIYTFKGRSFKFDIYPTPKNLNPKLTDGELFFAIDNVALPLSCRGWKYADKFRPFGMKSGSKKLSDFFTDLKLDKYQKNSQPILLDKRENIVCLPGLRIDDRYKITTLTKIIGEVAYI